MSQMDFQFYCIMLGIILMIIFNYMFGDSNY